MLGCSNLIAHLALFSYFHFVYFRSSLSNASFAILKMPTRSPRTRSLSFCRMSEHSSRRSLTSKLSWLLQGTISSNLKTSLSLRNQDLSKTSLMSSRSRMLRVLRLGHLVTLDLDRKILSKRTKTRTRLLVR